MTQRSRSINILDRVTGSDPSVKSGCGAQRPFMFVFLPAVEKVLLISSRNHRML
jgi:hypothetical protein